MHHPHRSTIRQRAFTQLRRWANIFSSWENMRNWTGKSQASSSLKEFLLSHKWRPWDPAMNGGYSCAPLTSSSKHKAALCFSCPGKFSAVLSTWSLHTWSQEASQEDKRCLDSGMTKPDLKSTMIKPLKPWYSHLKTWLLLTYLSQGRQAPHKITYRTLVFKLSNTFVVSIQVVLNGTQAPQNSSERAAYNPRVLA